MDQPPKPPEQESIPTDFSGQIHYFTLHPERIEPKYLNNLSMRLPGSPAYEILEKSADKPRSQEYAELHTDLWRGQTMRQFGETLKETLMDEFPELFIKVVEEMNDLQEIKREQDQIARIKKESLTDELRKRSQELENRYHKINGALNKELVPLYLEMRKKGYSHFDITQ